MRLVGSYWCGLPTLLFDTCVSVSVTVTFCWVECWLTVWSTRHTLCKIKRSSEVQVTHVWRVCRVPIWPSSCGHCCYLVVTKIQYGDVISGFNVCVCRFLLVFSVCIRWMQNRFFIFTAETSMFVSNSRLVMQSLLMLRFLNESCRLIIPRNTVI